MSNPSYLENSPQNSLTQIDQNQLPQIEPTTFITNQGVLLILIVNYISKR